MKPVKNFIESISGKYWAALLFLLIFFQVIVNFINPDETFHWFYIHENFFYTLIGFLLIGTHNNKMSSFQWLIIIVTFLFLSFTGLLEKIAQWVFFQSSLQHFFDKLAAKDANVISMFLIVVLTILNLLMETYSVFRHRYHLKRIFILLCSFVIIGTTVIFHYLVINQQLNHEKDDIVYRLNKIVSIDSDTEFKSICQLQGYQCITDDRSEGFKNMSPDIVQFIKENHYPMTSGNFVFSKNGQPDYVSLFKIRHRWIIDNQSYGLSFKKSEKLFLSLCCWAHGFWLLFLTFLILFHSRRKKIGK